MVIKTEIAAYPVGAAARNRWVLARRASKNPLDPWRPYAMLREEEAGADGGLISTLTMFLTNTECPYRCLMCDLWKNTLDAPTPPGAIPIWEEEAGADGGLISTLTMFLTNTECPYRCLMCDLWKNTLDAPTPPGAIP